MRYVVGILRLTRPARLQPRLRRPKEGPGGTRRDQGGKAVCSPVVAQIGREMRAAVCARKAKVAATLLKASTSNNRAVVGSKPNFNAVTEGCTEIGRLLEVGPGWWVRKAVEAGERAHGAPHTGERGKMIAAGAATATKKTQQST